VVLRGGEVVMRGGALIFQVEGPDLMVEWAIFGKTVHDWRERRNSSEATPCGCSAATEWATTPVDKRGGASVNGQQAALRCRASIDHLLSLPTGLGCPRWRS